MMDSASLTQALFYARASWAIAISSLPLAADMSFVGVSFLQQVTLYGKLSSLRGADRLWLEGLSISTSTGWTMFYAVGVFLTAASVYIKPSIPLCLVLIHVVRRLYECLFITGFSNKRMHPLNMVVGLGFYVLLPSSLLLEALAGSTSARPSAVVIVGGLCFALCSAAQHSFHCHLASLKPRGSSTSYKLPSHWMFKRISTSPHYTAEVLMYASLCVVEGGSPSCWLALLFTLCNLSITAVRTRRWYAEKFKSQPMSNYAIVPLML